MARVQDPCPHVEEPGRVPGSGLWSSSASSRAVVVLATERFMIEKIEIVNDSFIYLKSRERDGETQ